MCRIYNPEWLTPSPCDDDEDQDDEFSPLDDDWIPEEYRDADDD